MKSSLVIDTSSSVSVALFDKDLNFLDKKESKELKSSKVLHRLVYDMYQEKGLKVQDLKEVFYCAGPGSYTGLRLAKGFAEVFSLEGVEIKGFWYQDYLKEKNDKSSILLANAFKNEIYVFKDFHESLEELENLPEIINQEDYKCFSINDLRLKSEIKISEAKDLVFKDINNQTIHVLRKLPSREIFYYRSLEEEFSRPKI